MNVGELLESIASLSTSPESIDELMKLEVKVVADGHYFGKKVLDCFFHDGDVCILSDFTEEKPDDIFSKEDGGSK